MRNMTAEREMNRHQRGMVDGCFEEGHYQRGIATLNQLRMENLRPSPAHIRQLIYISLYPPPPSKAAARDKGKRKESTIVSGSPSKQVQAARRLQKQAFFPPPEATETAKELLHQYAIDSISPEALLRSVPCYPLSEAELESAPRSITEEMFFGNSDMFEDMDSYVAKQAARLKQCKDCWDILRKDIVTRQDLALLQKGDPFLDEDAEDEAEEADMSSAVLGRHSWHLLEWFILLFEKDEALAGDSQDATEEPYSSLLLSQLKPASRSGEARSSIDSAVEILFSCYNQTDHWRRNLGKRLMSLFVSLTRSTDFSPLQFLTAIGLRLQASSHELLQTFLGDIPVNKAGLAVKLAVCDRYLTQGLRGSTGTGGERTVRARPQARKARPASVHVNGETGSLSRSQGLGRNPSAQSHAQWNLPSVDRVVQLLDLNSTIQSSGSAILPNMMVLFHLIAAFGMLRAEEGKNADHLWVAAVQSGELENRIRGMYLDDALPRSVKVVIRPLGLLLISKFNSWKQSFV